MYWMHREKMKQKIEAAGGVVRTQYHDPDFYSRKIGSYITCKDGTNVYLDELVTLTPLSSDLPAPEGLPSGVTRSYEIQMSFGGQITRKKAEEALQDINYSFLNHAKPFELLLNDNGYFSEDVGISESIVTRHEDHKPLIERQSYSVNGTLWHPHFGPGAEYIPNPYTDPLGYRRWALAGDMPILEVTFQAPAKLTGRNGEDYDGMATLIDKFGYVTDRSSKNPPTEVMKKLYRFLTLLDFYYVQFIPEQDRRNVDIGISQFTKHAAKSLPSAD